MYKKILICYDGSEGSRNALKKGAVISKNFKCEVSAIWVKATLPHYPETIDEIEEEKEAADTYFQKLQEEIESFSKQEKIKIFFLTKSGNASKVIVDYIKEHKIDLTVMGHRGYSGLWGNFLGHVTDKVSENAGSDILIVR